ncbi:MAG: hypothetical protein ACOVMP_03300 [Chthoniobacterales bacterium]
MKTHPAKLPVKHLPEIHPNEKLIDLVNQSDGFRGFHAFHYKHQGKRLQVIVCRGSNTCTPINEWLATATCPTPELQSAVRKEVRRQLKAKTA